MFGVLRLILVRSFWLIWLRLPYADKHTKNPALEILTLTASS